MSGQAEYLRVQYVPDLFRAEARNVGVIVRRGDEVLARFVGERDAGNLDGRMLRGFSAPNAYTQWVRYWRRVIEGDHERSFDELLGSSGEHYRVVGGGQITDIGDDATADVLNFLYSRLVSEGGFSEAMQPALDEEVQEEEAEIKSLDQQLTRELGRLNILSSDGEPELVPVPVRRRPRVSGLKVPDYRPSYAQINGHIDLIETLDFGSRFRQRTRDHAGWMAYMFDDVKSAHGEDAVTAISVVRVLDGLFDEYEELRAAELLLRAGSDEVVNWSAPGERDAFLERRRRVAFLEEGARER